MKSGSRGKPYTRFPKRAFRSAVKRAGLEGRRITPHCLRHTFATWYGGTVTDLQELLGNADLKTTQIYAKPMDERTRAAVNDLDYGLKGDTCSHEMLTRAITDTA